MGNCFNGLGEEENYLIAFLLGLLGNAFYSLKYMCNELRHGFHLFVIYTVFLREEGDIFFNIVTLDGWIDTFRILCHYFAASSIILSTESKRKTENDAEE